MNEPIYITTESFKNQVALLNAGDLIYLSGVIYTARDQAHARLAEMIKCGKSLPFNLSGAIIYYAGPTAAPPTLPVGSIGPTTSGRMDMFTEQMLALGVVATIGKGERNNDVCVAILKYKSPYLCAIGGAGAVYANCVKSCEIIAFNDLGPESIKKLEIVNFPLIVGIDIFGGNLFKNKLS